MKYGTVLCCCILFLINGILIAAPCEKERALIEQYDFFDRVGEVLTVTFEDGFRKDYTTNRHTESWRDYQYYCLYSYYPKYDSLLLYDNPYETPIYRWINRISKKETRVGPSMIFSPDTERVLSINNGGCEMDGADAFFGIWNLKNGVLNQEFMKSYEDERSCAWSASWVDDNTIDVEFFAFIPPNYVFPHRKLIRDRSRWVWDDVKEDDAAER